MFTEAPGRTTVLQLRIDTGDAPSWSCNPRPVSIQNKAKLDVALEEMLNTGVVRPSQSAHASPIVLAPKKDGSVRLCVDYRRLNDVTVRDAYPFHAVESIISSLGGARVFTILDCSRDFLQIEMHPDDIPKTAFTCYRGLFEFVRMPFGLKNSPISFEILMDIVLGDDRYKYAIAYMDDVVFFSRTFEEHLVHLRDVLDRMKRAGLTINPKKAQLATSKVDLLGFVVDNEELRPNDAKLKAITQYPRPRDVKSLQRFLGMIAFYRSLIPHCAELSRPRNQLQ